MAVDAGLAGLKGIKMLLACTRPLKFRVHRFEIVAVAASRESVVFIAFHTRLAISRRFSLNFSGCIHGTHDFVKYFVAGLYLAHHLVNPGAGHVTVGAGGSDTGAVGVVYGWPVLLIDILFHFVTADTELQIIGRFHGGVESTPEK